VVYPKGHAASFFDRRANGRLRVYLATADPGDQINFLARRVTRAVDSSKKLAS
jgi:hypothetical protein